MIKPLSKEQVQLKKQRRLRDKSLEQHLLHRFLNHYGYDKGEITARAIIVLSPKCWCKFQLIVYLVV